MVVHPYRYVIRCARCVLRDDESTAQSSEARMAVLLITGNEIGWL